MHVCECVRGRECGCMCVSVCVGVSACVCESEFLGVSLWVGVSYQTWMTLSLFHITLFTSSVVNTSPLDDRDEQDDDRLNKGR